MYIPERYTRKLLLVGETPNMFEKPVLKDVLRRGGFDPKDVAFSPVIPGKMDLLRRAHTGLLQDIKEASPDVIVGLGLLGLRALLNRGVSSVTAYRNKELVIPGLELYGNPPYVTVTYHPSSVLSVGGYDKKGKMESDMQLLSAPRLEYPVDGVPHSCKTVGFDTEYDPDGKLLTMGVASDAHSVASDIDVHMGAIGDILQNAEWIVGHSLPGDLDFLVRAGMAKEEWLDGTKILDSLLLSKLYDENGREKGSYALGNLLRSVFRVQDWKQETDQILRDTKDAREWTKEQRETRCRLDAWATLKLAKEMWSRLKD